MKTLMVLTLSLWLLRPTVAPGCEHPSWEVAARKVAAVLQMDDAVVCTLTGGTMGMIIMPTDINVTIKSCNEGAAPTCAQDRIAKAQSLATLLFPYTNRTGNDHGYTGLVLEVSHEGKIYQPQGQPTQVAEAVDLITKALAGSRLATSDLIQTAHHRVHNETSPGDTFTDVNVTYVVVKTIVLEVDNPLQDPMCYRAWEGNMFDRDTLIAADVLAEVFSLSYYGGYLRAISKGAPKSHKCLCYSDETHLNSNPSM